MSLTPSTMLELGTPAPDIQLIDAVTNRKFTLDTLAGERGLLVMFICNHCPYVIHVRDELTRIAKEYAPRGIGIVAINSNDIENYPQDGPDHMAALAGELGWKFPFLFDETQTTAKRYRAACTPDFFAFDADRRLAYRGQLDDSRPNSGIPVTGSDLRAALDALAEGRKVPAEQKPSIGCNIKWAAGNEPEYFG